MRVVGPLLAGVLVATAGAGWAIAVDSCSFLAAALILSRIRLAPVVRAVGEVSFLGELGEGWRAVRSHGWLLAMMLDTALWCLVILGPYMVLGPVVSKRELGGAGAWALISAAYGVGSVAGGVLGLRLHPRRPLLVAVVINAAFVPLLGLLAIAAPTWLIAISGVPAGASIALYMVLWDTTIQERVPADLLARVSSFERMATFALMPLGMALAGPVAGVLGVGATLWASAAWLGVSTVFLLAIPSVRGLERASAPAAA
jgi:MFS family permease